jgi:hypothetical protein
MWIVPVLVPAEVRPQRMYLTMNFTYIDIDFHTYDTVPDLIEKQLRILYVASL